MTLSPDELSDAHREVLSAVYRRFAQDGWWPRTRVLRRDLRHLGYLESVVADLSPDLLVCSFDLDDASARCRLGPEGLASIPEAQRHRELVARGVKYLANRYAGSDERTTVLSARELEEHFGIGGRDLADLCELIRAIIYLPHPSTPTILR